MSLFQGTLKLAPNFIVRFVKELDLELNKILDWLKLSPKYLFAVSVVCGSILFGPEFLLKKLGLDIFIADYKKFIGVAFLGVNVLLFAHIFSFIYSFFNKKIKTVFYFKKRRKRLHSLTPDEKNILSYYIFNNTRSQILESTDGVVLGLEHEKIIYRASDLSSYFTQFPYNIQPWAWDYLNKNRYLLDAADSVPSPQSSSLNQAVLEKDAPKW